MVKDLYLFISLLEEFSKFEFDNYGYQLMISSLFNNYFISFFGPSIRFVLIDFYEKIGKGNHYFRSFNKYKENIQFDNRN
jgi:hypothetical protein